MPDSNDTGPDEVVTPDEANENTGRDEAGPNVE